MREGDRAGGLHAPPRLRLNGCVVHTLSNAKTTHCSSSSISCSLNDPIDLFVDLKSPKIFRPPRSYIAHGALPVRVLSYILRPLASPSPPDETAR